MSDQQKITEFSQSVGQNDSVKSDDEPDEFGWGIFDKPPEDWLVSRVEELFEVQKDSADPEELNKEELVRLYSMPAFDDGKEPELIKAGDIGSKKFHVPYQALLFPKLNISKKRFWFVNHSHDEPAFCSTEYWPLLPTDGLNLEFYLQYFNSDSFINRPRLSTSSTTNSHQRIKSNLFDKVRLPIPPLPEQRKIATVLYTVDRAIEKTSELIEQLDRIKQGIRQDILTSGITEDGKVRPSPESEPEQYRDARQWTVPNSWKLKELSDICSIQVGYAFKSDWYQEEGNVRVLRGANVGYGEPDWSDTYYLESERVPEYEEYLLDEGDLIIGMDRPYTSSGFKISRLSETDVPSLLVQRVGRFVPEACDPDYLHVVLSDWRYQKQVLRRAQGMDIPHISQTDILSPKIPLPPLEEQKRIADRYSSISERIDCEESLLREYKMLKQGLMQDLLSGTVRTTDVNIDVPAEIAKYG